MLIPANMNGEYLRVFDFNVFGISSVSILNAGLPAAIVSSTKMANSPCSCSFFS